MVFIVALVTQWVGFQLSLVADARFGGDADRLTQFFGQFNFLTGVVALLMQLFVTGPALRPEGELEVAVLKRNIDSLKSQLKKARQPLEVLKQIEEKLEEIEEKVEARVERKSNQVPVDSRQSLRLGERVTVTTLNPEGVVTALGESDAEVQVGSLRVRARLVDLVRRGQEEDEEVKKPGERSQEAEGSGRAMFSGTKSPGLELNLRRKLVEDGLEELERYLERAYSSGLLFVRIVHGKGTGRLARGGSQCFKGQSLCCLL